MPAVIPAEQDLVAAGHAPSDPDGHRTGFAAAFGIPDHLGAGNRPAQFFGEFDFQFVVDR